MGYYEIKHHGIKGQRWGVRRFQNEDGSLTAAGKKRYLQETERVDKIIERKGGRDTYQPGDEFFGPYNKYQKRVYDAMKSDWNSRKMKKEYAAKTTNEERAKYVDDFLAKYDNSRVGAWIADNDPWKKYSDAGRKYIQDRVKVLVRAGVDTDIR